MDVRGEDLGGGHVSTGRLPEAQDVQDALDAAHARYRDLEDGENTQVYPVLARAPREQFGIALAHTSGRVHTVGDADVPFTLMSVSKPFVFALVATAVGVEVAHDELGANATGLAFNSAAAVERSPDGRTNPMVNPGAIMATDRVPGATAEGRWDAIRDGLSRFAGRRLDLDEETYRCASATNFGNRGLAGLLTARGLLRDPESALDLYTRQCCLQVTARDLAVMGATLADGGLNPVTGDQVVGADVCHATLAVMIAAGMYETSGDWLYEIGLPGKSGIAGGIVTVSPGKAGLGTFAPPLDAAGNSVRGIRATRYLSHTLGLDLLASRAATDPSTAVVAEQWGP